MLEFWPCPNKLECCIILSSKDLLGTNALGYLAHSKVTKKLKCTKYCPVYIFLNSGMFRLVVCEKVMATILGTLFSISVCDFSNHASLWCFNLKNLMVLVLR
jgi:hypothetical protein